MIIDCKSPTWNPYTERYHVFVDGVEIQQVWYLDTELGIVKTYDLIDGGPLATVDLIPQVRARGEREGWEMPPGGVASRIIRGAVTLTPRTEPKWLERGEKKTEEWSSSTPPAIH